MLAGVAHPKLAVAADRHWKMLAALPEAMDKRRNNIYIYIKNIYAYHCNQMLSTTQACNLNIDRNIANSHISDFPSGLQRAATELHIGNIERRFHKLAIHGLP